MYESNENKIEWGPIIKKVGIFTAILFIVVIIIVLVSKCTKNNGDEPKNEQVPVTLSKELDAFESSLLNYINKDNLPKELNSSKTVRLKMLQDKELISELKNSEDNSCDANESFAEITKFENNYAVNLSLTCGSNKENRLIYVGCFSECNGGVCKGTSESIGGICEENPITNEEDNNTSNNSSNTTPSTPNTSTNTKKPSTSNSTTKPNSSSTGTTTKPNNSSSNTTTKPNNSNSSNNTNSTNKPNNSTNNNNNNSNNNNKVETMYEYKKCTINYSCSVGRKSGNKCIVEEPKTDYAQLLTRKVRSKTPNLHELNQGNRIFTYLGYYNGYYEYTEHYCENQGYTVDLNKNRCYGTVYQSVEKPAEENASCVYTWSYATSMDGWVKTGNTR